MTTLERRSVTCRAAGRRRHRRFALQARAHQRCCLSPALCSSSRGVTCTLFLRMFTQSRHFRAVLQHLYRDWLALQPDSSSLLPCSSALRALSPCHYRSLSRPRVAESAGVPTSHLLACKILIDPLHSRPASIHRLRAQPPPLHLRPTMSGRGKGLAKGKGKGGEKKARVLAGGARPRLVGAPHPARPALSRMSAAPPRCATPSAACRALARPRPQHPSPNER